jgi:ribulose bisphosphate carboxylase small subunit
MASQSIALESNRSTGPRTPEGKARSSQNATKHGLSAKSLTVLPHEQAEFENYQNELIDQIKPTEGLQADLCRQLVHAGWSLVRLEHFELQILEQGNPFDSPEAQAKLDRLERYRASHRRAYVRILADIRKLQTDDMLWATTHDNIQSERETHFPLANPSARPLNKEIDQSSKNCYGNDAIRDFEALENEASRQFNKTKSDAARACASTQAC